MSIKQEIIFNTSPDRVYSALIDAKQFAEFSKAPAEIIAESGARFSCFGGMITGMIIENTTNKQLVQAWRAGNWDQGVYSIVKFDIEEIGDGKTKLIFEHTGYPEVHKAHLEQGWDERYWQPMQKYLKI